MSNAVQPVLCFRPRASVYDNPCPMSVAVQEPEKQPASDRLSPNPAPPTYSSWNYHDPEKFFLILGCVVSVQALAIHLTLFHVDSWLLTKDMSCRKLPIPCGSQ